MADSCVVGLGRVELPTSPLSGVRSNHLSYRPFWFRIWWSWSGSNRRPPECKSGALPAELQPPKPLFRKNLWRPIGCRRRNKSTAPERRATREIKWRTLKPGWALLPGSLTLENHRFGVQRLALTRALSFSTQLSAKRLIADDWSLIAFSAPAPTFSLRKEVIQPQVLLRLPCYDFTPIMSHTLGRCSPCGLAHRLLVQPTFVM